MPGGDSRGRSESEKPSKPSRGAPKGSRNYLKHGVHAVTTLLKTLGTNRGLDRRTAIGKALWRWRQELIEDLGGSDNISAQQRVIVDLAVNKKLILDSGYTYVFQQSSLINKRKRALIPVVKELEAIANGLAALMAQLGLERRHKVKTISDLLNGDTEQPASDTRQ